MAVDQRARILDAAVGLMARLGSRGTSMRTLATACDLNVATLYHYFGSKQELLRAALAHRRAQALFAHPFPGGLPGTPAERLGALLDHVCASMLADDELWRVLLAEALHGDVDVLSALLELSDLFEAALGAWLAELIPEVPALRDPETVHCLRHALYGLLIEHLPQPDRREIVAQRARAIADVFARITEPVTTSL